MQYEMNIEEVSKISTPNKTKCFSYFSNLIPARLRISFIKAASPRNVLIKPFPSSSIITFFYFTYINRNTVLMLTTFWVAPSISDS